MIIKKLIGNIDVVNRLREIGIREGIDIIILSNGKTLIIKNNNTKLCIRCNVHFLFDNIIDNK